MPLDQNVAADEPLVFTAEIMRDNCIGDRGLRKWIACKKFPKPDGNLNGRNFWQRYTYQQWKADVIAGKYRQRPVNRFRSAASPVEGQAA